MNLLAEILLFCLVIAALQGILAVLAVAIVLALVVGLIWRPGEALPLLLVFALFAALDAHPLATIGAIGCLAGILLIAARARRTGAASPPRASQRRLLPPTSAIEPQAGAEKPHA